MKPLGLVQKTEPSDYPVSLDEAREHLKIPSEDTGENSLLHLMIQAATDTAEKVTRRCLLSRSYELGLDSFPSGREIELPKPPLVSVTSIKYLDGDGNEQTLSSTAYTVDTGTKPGRIWLNEDETWPNTYDVPRAVYITYTAGHASASVVPATIRMAILLMVGHWFENREAVVVGPTGLRIKEVPLSANMLLEQNRIMTFY